MNENMEIMEPDLDGSDQQQDDEKKFSQSEVDEIVKKRLQRQQKKFDEELSKQLDEKTAVQQSDLAARENAVACKEYLISNNYPPEIFDIVGAAELSEFKNKVSQLDSLLKPRQSYPMYEAEPFSLSGTRSDIQKAFSPDVHHKPKSWY